MNGVFDRLAKIRVAERFPVPSRLFGFDDPEILLPERQL
jgi:hypothetical protein